MQGYQYQPASVAWAEEFEESELQAAWDALQAVPSYVEQQTHALAAEKGEAHV